MALPLAAASRAFLTATVAALAADVLLAWVTDLLNVADRAGGAPLWIDAHLIERSRWVVVALLVVGLAGRRPVSSSAAADLTERSTTWRLTGLAVMAAPLLWIAATWIVQATLFTVAGRWDIDGRMFLSPGYYRQLLTDYVPWLLGGAMAVVASRHVD